MEDNIFDKIHDVDLKKYHGGLLYRLCDERNRCPCPSGRPDGLPVQRRVLYPLFEQPQNGTGLTESARTPWVNITPMETAPSYGALVNMAQDVIRCRTTGKFGSVGTVDRRCNAIYTIAFGLSKNFHGNAADINKNTVDFVLELR